MRPRSDAAAAVLLREASGQGPSEGAEQTPLRAQTAPGKRDAKQAVERGSAARSVEPEAFPPATADGAARRRGALRERDPAGTAAALEGAPEASLGASLGAAAVRRARERAFPQSFLGVFLEDVPGVGVPGAGRGVPAAGRAFPWKGWLPGGDAALGALHPEERRATDHGPHAPAAAVAAPRREGRDPAHAQGGRGAGGRLPRNRIDPVPNGHGEEVRPGRLGPQRKVTRTVAEGARRSMKKR